MTTLAIVAALAVAASASVQTDGYN